MKVCSTCGTDRVPIRDDGECFRCHARGIGFRFVGGAFYGKDAFHVTNREAIAQHVGEDRIRSGEVERVS